MIYDSDYYNHGMTDIAILNNNVLRTGAPNRGGGGWGVSTPPEFWMGGLNTCQPPLILRKKNLGGVGSS